MSSTPARGPTDDPRALDARAVRASLEDRIIRPEGLTQ